MTRGGGKEELGKVMGPLFPRLHVSHAGKGGGPWAPPRNKMALYEQLTVPSNRFSSRASGASLVPSTSAAQVSPLAVCSAFRIEFPVAPTQNSSLQFNPRSPCVVCC